MVMKIIVAELISKIKRNLLVETKTGQGNNGKDKTEGAVFNNVFGTYMHGPILAKSPVFADYLLELALRSNHQNMKLSDIR